MTGNSLIPDRPTFTWAIVPVKSLRESKSRLANVLTVAQRAELMATIFQRTMKVLSQTQGIDHILVISGDSTVLSMARERGAMTVAERCTCGLNPAVTQAIRIATAKQATAALILPTDLPFVRVSDVELMIRRDREENLASSAWRSSINICSDAKNEGTNALFISLPTRFTFQYGPDSFQKHREEAVRQGMFPNVIHAPCLEFDLDTEEDWHKYQHLAVDATAVPDESACGHPVQES